jgi:translation initiation factor 3 subunit E
MGRKGAAKSAGAAKSPPSSPPSKPAEAPAAPPAPVAAPVVKEPEATPVAAVLDAEPERELTSQEKAEQLAAYDLTAKMTPHLDRHLIFPILNFLSEGDFYKKADITRAEIALLSETNMVDFAVEKYALLDEKAPDALQAKREEVLAQLQEVRDQVLKLLQILEDPDELQMLKKMANVGEICSHFKLESNVFDGLLCYAKLQFDCGNYEMSRDLLKHYQSIMTQDAEAQTSSKQSSAMWGSLASHILNGEIEESSEIVGTLDDFLENTKMSKRELLAQRTWLLHWCLFCVFKAEQAGHALKPLDLLLAEKNMMIISISCSYLFRYISACLVLHKRLKLRLKETVFVMSQECSTYSDPVTRFLLALYVDVDFEAAQRELKQCKLVFEGDYFLAPKWQEFEENARLLIFEAYCRIHQRINIAMIATKLNMEPPEAEVWIVKLIQNAKLDARIDSEKSRVIMTKAPPNVYQQVIDKTKDLSFRSTMLLSHLDKREGEKALKATEVASPSPY